MAMTMREAKKIQIIFCIPSVKFLEYDRNTDQFTGIVGKPSTFIYGHIKQAFNMSFITAPKEESTVKNTSLSSRLPGCFGMLQEGKAHINLYPHRMPVLGIDNVTQVNASALQAGTYILSPYSPPESREEVHGPLDSLYSVSPEIWALVALMVVAFIWIMYFIKAFLYRSPTKRRSSVKTEDEALFGQSLMYQVITHMMQYETCDYSGHILRYVSILMSIFAFLYINMFSCMITSDKVSTTSIFVYDSYEKILSNPQVQPVWIKNLDDYSVYMKASKNSPQYKLWAKSVAIHEKNKDMPTLLEVDPVKIMGMGKMGRDQRMVAFVSNLFAGFFVKMLCNIFFSSAEGFEKVKDLRLKGTLDNDAPSTLYVFPTSRLTPPKASAAAEYLLRRVIETRLMHQPDFSHMLQLFLVKDYLQAKVNYNEDYRKCTDFEKLPSEDPETVPLFLKNTGAVFKWWVIGCLASLVLLLTEHMHHASRYRKSPIWSIKHSKGSW